jgi:hypothetical protein
MYIMYRVDVTDQFKPGEENELEILFHSTFLIGKQPEKERRQSRYSSTTAIRLGCKSGKLRIPTGGISS